MFCVVFVPAGHVVCICVDVQSVSFSTARVPLAVRYLVFGSMDRAYVSDRGVRRMCVCMSKIVIVVSVVVVVVERREDSRRRTYCRKVLVA